MRWPWNAASVSLCTEIQISNVYRKPEGSSFCSMLKCFSTSQHFPPAGPFSDSVVSTSAETYQYSVGHNGPLNHLPHVSHFFVSVSTAAKTYQYYVGYNGPIETQERFPNKY